MTIPDLRDFPNAIIMRNYPSLILFAFLCPAAAAQPALEQIGQLANVQLLRVERLSVDDPDHGPDGLSFCFLVSRTPVGQHEFGLKETRDFQVDGQSYQQVTEAALGRTFKPRMAVHDAAKYIGEHRALASAVSSAPPRSLIVTVAISGAKLEEGQDLEITLQAGFGRTPRAPQVETFTFRPNVPAPAATEI